MGTNNYRKYEPIFGSWHIKEKIGEGSFGSVYAIERKELGVTYRSALKVITVPRDKSEIQSAMSDGMSLQEATEYFRELVENIIDEFIIMSKLKGNSHIVSYEDHVIMEHEDDIGWDILIRMEILTPLVEHTSENTMEQEEIIKLGIDMCKALELCRKFKIIHRDIKPENIFITSGGDYKLGDFGIAKTVEKTRIGLSRKGTYTYMAPEVYKGEAYGPTVDIYSLGIVLYKHLNNNRTPFMPAYPHKITYDDRENALIKRIRGDVIPPPEKGTNSLKQAVLKACSFNPEERYPTAKAFRKDLEILMDNPNARIDKVAKKSISGKHKKIIAAAAVFAVLLTGGIGYLMIPKAPEDISGFGPEETIYIGDTITPKYTVSPERFADEPVYCESEDSSILTVDAAGKITAESVGKCKLILSAGEYSEKVTVRVIPKVTGISGVDEEISVTEGNSTTISPELSPEKFSDEKISYKIKDTSIAAISDEGTITGISPGTTVLTISAGGYSKDYSLIINQYVAPKKTPSVTTKKSTTKKSSGGDYFGGEEFF